MKTDFTATDIFKALEIPKERLRSWMKLGFIVPTIPIAGQGKSTIFTLEDVYIVALFKVLIEHGFSREVAAHFIKDFKREVKREKDAGGYPETRYILFRVPSGAESAEVLRLGPGSWKISVEDGNIDWFASNPLLFNPNPSLMTIEEGTGHIYPVTPVREKESWSILHMINYKALCEEVDLALSKL